jgi:Chaperone of endosialidase/Head domain of trimeric autotransporter adhesin
MKNLLLMLVTFLTFLSNLNAQVGINSTNTPPNPTAMLDVNSPTKGLLIPRMTAVQKAAINPVPTGLMVYDLTLNQFSYFNGSVWIDVSGASGSPWTVSAPNSYYNNSGNVGIGTTSPTSKLDVLTNVSNSIAVSGINSAGGYGVYGRSLIGGFGVIGEAFGANAKGGLFFTDGSAVNETALRAETISGGTAAFFTAPGATGKGLIVEDGNVGIGNIAPTKAKLIVDSPPTIVTNAIFGSNGSGISLQKNWPTIGFNSYRDNANVQKYMSTGFGFLNAVDITSGTMFWNKLGTGVTDGLVGANEGLVMRLLQNGKLEVSGNLQAGELASASAPHSIALGYNSQANDNYSIAIGRNCTASKFHAVAIGQSSEAQQFASIAIGAYNKAKYTYSMAIGSFSEADGNSAAAIGNGVIATAEGSLAVGSYNAVNANGLFMVGNGTFSSRQTPFIIRKDNNRVGVGTVNPEAPLHVQGSATSLQSFAFYAANGLAQPITGTVLLANIDVSILASNRVVASEFNAFSDIRHKRILARNDSETALSKIIQLKPTQYNFIDTVSKGNKEKLGFIAQEVEIIIPLAVSKSKEYIPNIFDMALSFEHEQASKTLTIQLRKPHDLKIGDDVKIVTNSTEYGKVSKVIDDKTFVLEGITNKPEGVFVFGKKVDDFRVVDYDHIFTMGISAIQALAKENEQMKKENAKQKADFTKRIESIEATLQAMNQSTMK